MLRASVSERAIWVTAYGIWLEQDFPSSITSVLGGIGGNFLDELRFMIGRRGDALRESLVGLRCQQSGEEQHGRDLLFLSY